MSQFRRSRRTLRRLERQSASAGPALRLFFWFHRLRRSAFHRDQPSVGVRIIRYLAFGLVLLAGSWTALILATLVGGITGLLLALGAIPLTIGLAVLTASRTGRTPTRSQIEDVPLSTKCIRLAQRCGGDLTVNQTAAALGLPYESSEAELDNLARKGACALIVSDDGVVIYRFTEFRGGHALDVTTSPL